MSDRLPWPSVWRCETLGRSSMMNWSWNCGSMGSRRRPARSTHCSSSPCGKDTAMRPRVSPPLSLLEVALAALAACAIAAAMHWPLPLHLGRDVSRDIGDPLVQAWEVAWGGHALRHQPLDYFQANTFWPLQDS